MPGKTNLNQEEDAAMEDAPASAQKPQPTVESQENAEPMQEDGENGGSGVGEAQDEEPVEDVPKVRILPGSSPTAASFEFTKEGHTLGNALRYIIMKNPDVEFCAYSIPHPSEDKMNVRIQTYEGTTATAALEKGLQDLEDLCDVVSEKFWTARNEFNESQP
ncbi:hypothetical protein MGN70_011159 [Eutypa lata]|uniref:DNA-directed RNA polymerases I and III subunit RPAC2 n=1 Tax=Eutypa lata (strain UCR-EL1) TaxID=1287681 RepID=M7SKI7_EUTLA|nr:putative dna-directed rna polymerase i and iii 14 kda polypeptide protein [Eutypa lata UCREL1]KAI1247272.1 hypothetical protein MGN70_011159 [Eutypa lata]